MKDSCWNITKERGFLMNPDPIADLSTVSDLNQELAEHLQRLSEELPKMIVNGSLRLTLQKLHPYDFGSLDELDAQVIERLFQIYVYFANAYVWCEQNMPSNVIPSGVAIPLVKLAQQLERPPILPYASTALSNFSRIDPAGGFVVDNLEPIQSLIATPDEAWFNLTHTEIEMHAGTAIQACLNATRNVLLEDVPALEHNLSAIPKAFERMIATFKRMPKGCRPETYFSTLRPYLFGFDGVIYEGVIEYENKPQIMRGQTGAQSSVIPAIQDFLGLEHEQGGLSRYMEHMKEYMPRPHRDLLKSIDKSRIRAFVRQQENSSLSEVYNACLKCVFEFRSLHLHFAHAYVASKVEDPRGTGGTDFMRWLKQLRDETEQQYL